MRLRPSLALAALLFTALGGGGTAHAQSAPVTKSFGYSPYEKDTIEAALRELDVRVDPAPEGKIVEDVQTYRIDVFEKRDPIPRIVNVFHTLTKSRVIEREYLQKIGDRYQQLLVDETERNLRSLPQLSLVLAIPLRGSAPDRVRLLIITKDVWSLRLQWDLALSNGGLERLVINPAETNLAGLHQSSGVSYTYLPFSTSLGAYYSVPRIWTSRVAFAATANLTFNNRTGDPEGSFGGVSIGEPLWSAHTRWAWSATGQWRNEVTRRYSAARLAVFDSNKTPYEDDIPFEYRSELGYVSAAVTRSFGWATKHDFILSANVTHKSYRTDDLGGWDPAAVADFVTTRVPVSDDRVGPALEWRSYSTSFSRVLDLQALGIQEDVRLGHYLDAKVYPVFAALGSSRTFLGVYAEAGYTLGMKDGIARADLSTTTEVSTEGIIQGSLNGELQIATPRFGIGRLVYAAQVIHRYENYLNLTSYLGGNTLLRGYPSNFLVGRDLLASNLEYRTRPLQILGSQIGGVLFYDVGDAFDGFSRMSPKHAVGFGVRLLFPFFDRAVFRADVGFPVSATPLPVGVPPVSFFVTVAQALALPTFGGSSPNIASTPSN